MRNTLLFVLLFQLVCPQSPAQTDTTTVDLSSIEVVEDSTSSVIDEEFILQADSLWLSLTQERTAYIDSLCGSTPENPEFSDSIYIERLSQLPRVIEMPYNGIVRNYIDFYLSRHRDWIELISGNGQYYFPIFEQELDAQGLPLELKYLPVIESALNPNAVSRVGATGIWQLMLATARGFGLNVNSLVDERRDPVKATKVAVQFLKELYSIYGDWNLAIAAYNCGPGNVNRAINRAGGKRDFWEIYYYLPRETRGYVPGFIAANYTMEYYKEHGICPTRNPFPAVCDTVVLDRMIHFEQVAELTEIPVADIKRMNPMYRKQIVPGNIQPYSMVLPHSTAATFHELLDSIASHKPEDLLVNARRTVDPSAGQFKTAFTDRAIYHKVTKGQTISTIAAKYKVTQDNLRNWNGLKRNRLREGQNLLVFVRDPSKKSSATTDNQAPATVSTNAEGKTIYSVRNGDSLWKIAGQFPGVSPNDIMRANGLTGTSKLSIGQKLIIPIG